MKLLAALLLTPLGAVVAEVMPPPDVFAGWIQVAMYLILSAGGIVGLLVGVKALRGGSPVPQPMVVKGAEQFATAEELRQAHGRIGRERDEINKEFIRLANQLAATDARMDAAINGMRKEAKEDMKGMHSRFDQLLSAVSKLEGRVDSK